MLYPLLILFSTFVIVLDTCQIDGPTTEQPRPRVVLVGYGEGYEEVAAVSLLSELEQTRWWEMGWRDGRRRSRVGLTGRRMNTSDAVAWLD